MPWASLSPPPALTPALAFRPPLWSQLLIFDDMRFDKEGLDLSPEQMICLLDAKEQVAIKCRHYDGIVPCIPRIFTTNLNPWGGRE